MSFERACSLDEFREGEALAVEVGDQDDRPGRATATRSSRSRTCAPTPPSPLSEGDVEGCTIECWLHGSRFDLRTGKPTGLPGHRAGPHLPRRDRRRRRATSTSTTTLNGVNPT